MKGQSTFIFSWAIVIASVWIEPVCAIDPEPFTLGGYVDAHIAHDFNKPPTRYRYYTTQPYYSDEPALNLGFIDAKLDSEQFKGRIALQYGSSVIANYSEEPEVLARYIQEAHLGLQITDDWDVAGGVFLSHIGLESWISGDNYISSRALISDYSPYYQSGVRTRYRVSDRLRLEGHLLRGWQNISDEQNPALGTRVEYEVSNDVTLTHNTFYGHEDGGKRIFNNFIIQWAHSDSFGIDASYDIGVQGRNDQSRALWYGWAVVPHMDISDSVRSAVRIEQFTDNHNVVITSESGGGFNTMSIACNVDLRVMKDVMVRGEYRVFVSHRDLFPREEGLSASDSFVMLSLVLSQSAR